MVKHAEFDRFHSLLGVDHLTKHSTKIQTLFSHQIRVHRYITRNFMIAKF